MKGSWCWTTKRKYTSRIAFQLNGGSNLQPLDFFLQPNICPKAPIPMNCPLHPFTTPSPLLRVQFSQTSLRFLQKSKKEEPSNLIEGPLANIHLSNDGNSPDSSTRLFWHHRCKWIPCSAEALLLHLWREVFALKNLRSGTWIVRSTVLEH